ncbi:DUF3290 domain-containing protein [Alloscardovia omnicolens]|uniref:DUF3290 domain-containing protein n=2 Tax=Alloscardovia omnicolens TaxID=419015 RepID=U1R9M1_9BIFI|nr:DUF3290 domain-containing protein [Alloscardovia omnicolens]ERH30721.1 hypothetical protein HMPREF9244_00918 [Alloscardovia omnicolens F0580]KWZ74995.1 hypothetical protein HMPREF3214_00623 [Alloscardovia omnicolens]MBS6346195.1 DUF3290 domain-containing protein [Alloscardovia omnicolens]MDK6249217.1 DUF3290 domain-containing protein [Alloscardovia omnicolens]MDK6250789.1 DUF3290 domain-containing protein [Alloscardovia omnicolens]
MHFYTLAYITQHQSANVTLRLVILIALFVALLFTSLRYLHNKMKTRLRDLSIGLVVLFTILLGINVQDYMQSYRDVSQAQMLSKFFTSISIDHNVPVKDIVVNSTTLKDGMIVRFNEEDYTVHLGDDNNTYTLERTHVIDHHVYID